MINQRLIDGQEAEQSVMGVADLIRNPVYDTQITVQGEVQALGELLCPCFILVSQGETLHVWYGLMVTDDGIELPSVSVDGIENGDWVAVTGELKLSGVHTSLNDFWPTDITKIDRPVDVEDPHEPDPLIGGTPGSCGYAWDRERGGWHRPWDSDSFVPAEDKPEWDKFIPSFDIVSATLVDSSISGGEVKMSVGDSVMIELASNPSTGFQWELIEISNEAVLEYVDQEFMMPEHEKPLPPGTPGYEIWTFKAIGLGNSTFSMEYSRPWEGGEKAMEEFTLTVVVEQ
jgi:inhibitor of cysteine peptidase